MRSLARILICLGVLVYVGCGGNTQNPTQNNPPILSGTWEFRGSSQVAFTDVFTFGGPLTSDATGRVNATLGIASLSPNTCIPAGGTFTLTGTVSSAGQVSLTGSPINGQVINVMGAVNTGGNVGHLGSPTYTVTGGCLGGDHGIMSEFRLLDGTASGSFLTPNGLINVTVMFGHPGLPASDGTYPLTGTASFTNSSGCGGFTTATVQQGLQSGNAVSFNLLTNTGTTIAVQGTTTDSLTGQFSGGFTISGGACDTAKGQIQLSGLS